MALQCRDDVAICRECIGWLRSRAGIVDSTPILPVSDLDRSQPFYEACGFEVRRYDDGFGFVTYEDESVFDVDRVPESAGRSGCYLVVPNVDEWHTRLSQLAVDITALEEQPWGMKEFTLTDPDGNYVRIGTST